MGLHAFLFLLLFLALHWRLGWLHLRPASESGKRWSSSSTKQRLPAGMLTLSSRHFAQILQHLSSGSA